MKNDGPTRQHYRLATGKGIQKSASGPSTKPRMAKGGYYGGGSMRKDKGTTGKFKW